MADGSMTDRGWVEQRRVGDLVFSYRTGRDAPAASPVFDMSVGEITVENVGTRVVNVRYSVHEIFFAGHRFELGPAQEKAWSHGHIHFPGPEDAMSYDSRPGKKALLSRQDYMGLLHRLGLPGFLDGTMRTQFHGLVVIDDAPHELDFGPRLFVVDLDRDWDEERARYGEFFAARDRGEIAL